MKRTPTTIDTALLPSGIREYAQNAVVYDSSCSPEARVYLIDKDGGYYLKIAANGALALEARMTEYFSTLELGARVVKYISGERDMLLTTRVSGEDCTHSMYLEQPERLCDSLAQIQRSLHEADTSGCPVADRTAQYLAFAEKRYAEGHFDNSLISDKTGYETADKAIAILRKNGHLIKSDSLIHGDFCLPNVMMDNWRFSGFIDVDHAGIGDRHIDLFWTAWSLAYNLKTDKYTDRFFDAYGRDDIDTETLKTVIAAETFG